MDFLFPKFLWALAALLIPIIVHLFHFRRFKKVKFTNVKLLEEVMQQTSTHKRIKHWLILLSRLMALAALIIAFAQPFIKKNDQIRTGKKSVSVFLDNSYSMQGHQEGVSLFEQARAKAHSLVAAFDESDVFQIITNDFSYKEKNWMSKTDALEYLDQIDLSSSSVTFDRIVSQINYLQMTSGQSHKLSYWFSDFQKSQFGHATPIDSSIEVYVHLLQRTQDQNISLDSAWFVNPTAVLHQDNQLVVSITNHSLVNELETKLSYTQHGRRQAMGTLSIQASSTITDTSAIRLDEPGWQEITLHISDDPVHFDDQYHIAFDVLESLKILSIKNELRDFSFAKAFESLSYARFDEVAIRKLNYSRLKDYNLIILQEVDEISSGLRNSLIEAVANGQNVLVIPSATADIEQYNQLLSTLGVSTLQQFVQQELSIHQINQKSDLFKKVYDFNKRLIDYPTTLGHYRTRLQTSHQAESLIRYRDGSHFLVRFPYKAGNLFLQTAPIHLKWSNFINYVDLWLPMLYNMALASNHQEPLAFVIGQAQNFDVTNPSDISQTYKVTGEHAFIPEQRSIVNGTRIQLHDQVKDAGFYQLRHGDRFVRSLAFNYNRTESVPTHLVENEIQAAWPTTQFIKSDTDIAMAEMIKTQNQGIPLWKYGLYLALLFLLTESLLIRYMK